MGIKKNNRPKIDDGGKGADLNKKANFHVEKRNNEKQ